MKRYLVTYKTPADEFDPGGDSIVYVKANNSREALIKANVMYYGETVPTSIPPHPVKVQEVS
jgi:hypothetical protein